MDVSETYVKMCEKAEEIQQQAPAVENTRTEDGSGSWFYLPNTGEAELLHYDNDEQRMMVGHYHDDPTGAIWLPRQDQLQEMAIPEGEADSRNKFVALLDDFQYWVLNDCSGLEWGHKGQVSMEQLWLAFVMKENYGKVWNGEDWNLRSESDGDAQQPQGNLP